MAALLVKLQWRQTFNIATKSVWAIVGLVFGLISAFGLMILSFFGVTALRVALPEILPTALLLVGALIPVFWTVSTVMLSGQDQLAAEKFSLLPVTGRQLAAGNVAAGVFGIGGITALVWLVAATIGWTVAWPAAIAFAVLIPLTLVNTVLIARVVAIALARAFASRALRDVTSIVLMLLLVTVGVWAQLAIGAAAAVGESYDQFGAALNVVAYTPLAATYGVSLALLDGSMVVAGIRLLIAIATAVVLFWLLERMLSARLTNPVQMRGGGTIKGGGLLERLFPATPVGAIAVRSLRYRRRDPRHVMNTILMPFLPVFIMVVYSINDVVGLETLPYLGLFLPLMVLTVVGMDLAYDHANLAMHILAGVTGRDDRAGRALAIGCWAVPFAVLLVVVPTIFTGIWDHLVPALALVLPATLMVLGIASFLGVHLPGRAPKPGTSPFGKGSSGGVQAFLLMGLGLVAAVVLMLPTIALVIAGIWTPWFDWLALLVGVASGIVVLVLGIRMGGKALDKHFPRVLATITSES